MSTGQRRNTITVETPRASNNQSSSCLYLALSWLLEAAVIPVRCYWCKQSSCRGFPLCESGIFSVWPSSGFAFFSTIFILPLLAAALNIPGSCFDGSVPRPRTEYCHLVPPTALIIAPESRQVGGGGQAENRHTVSPRSTNNI